MVSAVVGSSLFEAPLEVELLLEAEVMLAAVEPALSVVELSDAEPVPPSDVTKLVVVAARDTT